MRAASGWFLPAWVTFIVGLDSESHWLQLLLVLTVHWWPKPVSAGGLWGPRTMDEWTNFDSFTCHAPSVIPFMPSNVCHSSCVIYFMACPITRIRNLGFRVLRRRICQSRFVVPQLQHTHTHFCALSIALHFVHRLLLLYISRYKNTNRGMRFRRIENAHLFMIVKDCWRFRI